MLTIQLAHSLTAKTEINAVSFLILYSFIKGSYCLVRA